MLRNTLVNQYQKFMEVNAMLKVGLVGVGAISGAHISGWADYNGAELVAV